MAEGETPLLANGNGSMSVTEVTGLVQLFNNQLLAMEGRLITKMDDNSKLASERWIKHDLDLERNRATLIARFEKLEHAVLTVEQSLQAHLDKEHDEELTVQARIKPVKNILDYTVRNWRTIALWVMLVLTFMGVVAGRLYDFFGLTP